MRIAIIGPTHPYKGGIAQETTELAHRLTASGHSVSIISWRAMYPKLLYPGNQFVPGNTPEVPLFDDTKRVLNWKNPVGWWKQIRKLRSYDLIIFVWWVPTIQGPVYLTMLKALGKKRPRTLILCHNVLPHEPRPGDRQLARKVFSSADRVLVHSLAQQEMAQKLTTSEVILSSLPPVLPRAVKRKYYTLQQRLVFFGIVRPYKGLDVLLKALKDFPNVRLTVAGEFWKGDDSEKLITELHLEKQVTLRKGYIANEDLEALFSTADAMVLPYRGGTATYNVAMAHNFDLPVIATTASSLGSQVRDGYDGLLCEPNNVPSLTAAIRSFYKPGVASKLQAHVNNEAVDQDWLQYVSDIITPIDLVK